MPPTTADEVIDALMAGDTADELQSYILCLSVGELQLLLAKARQLRGQIAAVCLQRADEIDRLLTNNTPTQVGTAVADRCSAKARLSLKAALFSQDSNHGAVHPKARRRCEATLA